MKRITYSKQSLNTGDILEVVKVLKSDWITQGPAIEAFENALARFCGAKYVVAVASGTAALHLASLAAGLKKGDEAITSPITFVATANAVLYAGARPVFADICEDSLNIDPEEIERKITKKTKALIPVHFAGLPCDMEKISRIARKYKLLVIEDAAHALGARYRIKGKWFKVGTCAHSDMTIFSFHPVKHITTGEGGAIATNSLKLYTRLKALRSHGIYKDSPKTRSMPWFYQMRDLGFNYRITDFQCALGLSQLKRIEDFIEKRRNLARLYDAAFAESRDIGFTRENKNQYHCYHLYPIRVKSENIRSKLFNYLKKEKIFCQVHYIPVYLQPYYQRLGFKRGLCPRAEKFYSRAISLPLYPDLKRNELEYVVEKIRGFFKA